MTTSCPTPTNQTTKENRMNKERLVEIALDASSLWNFLDSIADHIPPDISNEDLNRFLRSGLSLSAGPAQGTDGTLNLYLAVFKPTDALLELLPALRTGELTFGALNDILNSKIGILNEFSHE
jgi:hypothetical protein